MSSRFEPVALLAAPAGLLAARLLGIDPLAVWCAFAVCVMLPGWGAMRLLRVERELGLAGASAVATALGLAVWIAPLAAAFAAGLPLGAPLAVVLGAGVLLCLAAVTRPLLFERVEWWEVVAGAVAAAAFAFVAWRLSTGIISDALFHVGRMRKLSDLGSLSITDISSYKDGAPHAGYAFPLLHAAFAGTARVAGVDVATAFVYLLPLCAFLTMTGAFAVARSLTGWRTAGYLAAAVLAWDLVTLINGLIMQVNQPPVFTFFVLTPAAILLFIAAMRGSRSAAWATMAAVAVIALVHPTYAAPSLAIAAGIALGSWRAHLRMPPVALEALAASFLASAAAAAWIWWVAIDGGQRRQIITHSDEFLHHGSRAILMYPWAPVFGRGYVLVAIIGLILLARYRDMLPTAGAMLAPLVLLLLPGLSTVVLAVSGMGQFHRFWQVLPWPAVLAATACVAAGLLGWRRALPVALVLAVLMTVLRVEHSFWRQPTSIVVVAALLGVLAALILRPRKIVEAGPWWVSSLLVAAVMLGPVWEGVGRVWDEAKAGPHRAVREDLRTVLTPDVWNYFRGVHGPPPVVLGEDHRLFELLAYADVYAAALPEARSRAEPKVDTAGRRQDELTFFDPATTAAERTTVIDRLHADYVLLDTQGQSDVAPQILSQPGLKVVYRGPRFVILRVER
ncbi:MAG TPA: DUF6541 family protein [Gaiellales bacterium]|nr:DUF6541 family protein [Gaiellales bacterium]